MVVLAGTGPEAAVAGASVASEPAAVAVVAMESAAVVVASK